MMISLETQLDAVKQALAQYRGFATLADIVESALETEKVKAGLDKQVADLKTDIEDLKVDQTNQKTRLVKITAEFAAEKTRMEAELAQQILQAQQDADTKKKKAAEKAKEYDKTVAEYAQKSAAVQAEFQALCDSLAQQEAEARSRIAAADRQLEEIRTKLEAIKANF